MAGNVIEWCHDWRGDDYYSISPVKDPRGPDSGTSRIVRGGWFGSSATKSFPLFVANRRSASQNGVSVGFRCVSSVSGKVSSHSSTYQLASTASYTLNLKTGLNMISLPVRPDQVATSKTLAQDLAATVILHLDADSQKFIPFVPEHYEGTDFDIEGGMGIIVNVREEKAHTFTGTIWSNTSVAAPSISINPVWAFTMLFEGQALDHSQLSVTNLSRGISFSTQLDDSCQMGTASVVDSSQQSVINTGDLIQVRADGQRWRYRVTDEDLANAFAHLTLDADLRVPEQTQLLQNYPNPFNPETWLPFKLVQDAIVTAKIYDVTGKQIRVIELGHMPAGNDVESSKAIYWDGKKETGEVVSSGTYFYQIEAGEYTETRKMVVLK